MGHRAESRGILEWWNIGMLGGAFEIMEVWKNGTMGTGLGKNSMIHFIWFYLKFFYNPDTIFQPSNLPLFLFLRPIIPSFQHSNIPAGEPRALRLGVLTLRKNVLRGGKGCARTT